MRVEVLLNDRAGTSVTSPDAVAQALAAAGADPQIHCVPGDKLQDAARQAMARRPDAIVAGGGDGTVSAVAGALAGGETPMGVLPLGTLNHFAKDNGIPLELSEAAAVVAAGHVRRVDLARVNERVFVNNSSLGVYARALVDRDARRDHLGMSKWPAMLLAILKIFRRSPLLRVRLATDEESLVRQTPLVFIGNNRYDLELFRVGARTCLDEGTLSMYIANTTTRWGMFVLCVRAALGRLEQSRDFETRCVEGVRIATRRATTLVAVDGEVLLMETPLEYQALPGALELLVPRGVQP